MALIKSQNASSLLKEAIVLDLGDLGRQAAKLQEAADAKARKTIADAQQEAAGLVKAAHGQGLTQGHKEGLAKGTAQGLEEGRKQGKSEALKEATAQLQKIQQSWKDAAADWEGRRDTLEREARDSVLDLALTLAEKLVHRIIEVDRSVVVDQVGNVLSQVLRAQDVNVRIAPQDRPLLREAMPQLVAEFTHLKHINLVDDDAISPGGCVVVYGQGQIDATIETQLRRVVEFMLPDGALETPAPALAPASPAPGSSQAGLTESGSEGAGGSHEAPAKPTGDGAAAAGKEPG